MRKKSKPDSDFLSGLYFCESDMICLFGGEGKIQNQPPQKTRLKERKGDRKKKGISREEKNEFHAKQMTKKVSQNDRNCPLLSAGRRFTPF